MEILREEILNGACSISATVMMVKAARIFDGDGSQYPSGAMTVIKGVEVDDDFKPLVQVLLKKAGRPSKAIYCGIICLFNERFLKWEDTFFAQTAMFTATGGYPDIEQFSRPPIRIS